MPAYGTLKRFDVSSQSLSDRPLPLFFTDSRKADWLIRQLTWHSVFVVTAGYRYFQSHLNQLWAKYDAGTCWATSSLRGFSWLATSNNNFKSAAWLNCRRSFERFFIVLIIASHVVFDIFVNFLIYKALTVDYTLMAAKRAVHDSRYWQTRKWNKLTNKATSDDKWQVKKTDYTKQSMKPWRTHVIN